MSCPTCGLPMVWSQDRERMHCCVYGGHPVVGDAPRPPLRLVPSPLIMEACRYSTNPNVVRTRINRHRREAAG